MDKKCDESRPFCFVSYSSEDREYVFSVVDALIEDGFNIWIDRELINHIGTEWYTIAHGALLNKNCKCILWFVSRNSIASGNVADELLFARAETTTIAHEGQSIKIYPVEIEKIKPASDLVGFCNNVIKFNRESGNAQKAESAQKIVGLIVNNSIKRLSVEQIFTDQGRKALAQSMRNDGYTDIVEHPFLKTYKKYYEKIIGQSVYGPGGRLFGDEIEAELLPYVTLDKNEVSIAEVVQKVAEGGSPDFKWLLMGRGGSGKTIALYFIMQYFVGHGVAAFYVPLSELSGVTILDYILRQLELHRNIYTEQLESFLCNHKTLFLLDGLNEVQPEQETFVKNQISLITEKKVNIIITSRPEANHNKYKFLLDDFSRMEISPMSSNSINQYLSKNGYDQTLDGKLLEILSLPLMLKMYTVQLDNPTNGTYYTLDNLWKRDNTMACLIWNFMLTECRKKWNMANREDDIYLFAFLYVAPYIAWNMVNLSRMSIGLSECNSYIKQARAMYERAYDECMNSNGEGAYNADFFNNIPYFGDMDTRRSLFDLLKDFGILYVDSQNKVFFYHQIFRDCFCAINCFNALSLNPDADCKFLALHVLPDEVLRYLDELDSERIIDNFWQKIDNGIDEVSNTTRINMIKLYNARYGNLSRVDFSGKNLQNIRLTGYDFVSEGHASKFCEAKISDLTFAAPATHLTFINNFAVTDDFNYIVTGSNCGDIIVFDVANGSASGVKVTIEGCSNTPVKAVDIVSGNVCVCFANGYIARCELKNGELIVCDNVNLFEGHTLVAACVIAEKYYIVCDNGNIYRVNICDTPFAAEEVIHIDDEPTCMVAYKTHTLFCGMASGAIFKINVAEGSVTSEWKFHAEAVTALAVKETYLFSASLDKMLCKCNLISGVQEPAGRWNWNRGVGKHITDILASDRCPYIFTCSADGNLIKSDASSGLAISTFKLSGTKGNIHYMAFSKDEKFIVFDCENLPVIYEVEGNGKCYRDFKNNLSGAVVSINCSNNGKYAIASSVSGYGIECVVWDLEKGIPIYKPISILSLWGKTKAIANDGKTAYLGAGEHTKFYKFGQNSIVGYAVSNDMYKGWLYSIAIDEEKGVVWLGTDFKKIYKVGLSDFKLIDAAMCEDKGVVNCFATGRVSNLLYYGTWNGKVGAIDTITLKKVKNFDLSDYNDWVNDLYLSDDEKTLFAALDNGYVVRWEADSCKTSEYNWHYDGRRVWDKPGIQALTVDASSGNLVVLTNDYCIYLLDQSNFSQLGYVNIQQIFGDNQVVRSCSLVNRTSNVLVGLEDGDMISYDICSQKVLKRYHRIKNVCLVGCDFRNADFIGDSNVVSELLSSGAII